MSRGRKHNSCYEEENPIPTVKNLKHTFNQALIYAIQEITQALDELLKNNKSHPYIIQTLREAITDTEEDNQWKDICLLPYIPTATDILSPSALYFKIHSSLENIPNLKNNRYSRANRNHQHTP